jgi:hypothetical protein
MRIKSLFTLLILGILLPGLILGLSGCSGGSSEPSSQDSVATDTTDPVVDESDAVETPAPVVAVPDPEEIASDVEPVIETPEEQAILTWARDAGGLNHCDRLSIYEDGRVEAVVCKATASYPVVHSTLSEDQLAQVEAWVSTYGFFSRREMEVSSAVRSTVVQGTGAAVPELEIKVAVAAFAAELFFAITEPE